MDEVQERPGPEAEPGQDAASPGAVQILLEEGQELGLEGLSETPRVGSQQAAEEPPLEAGTHVVWLRGAVHPILCR